MHVADQARRLPGVVDANLCLATEANRAALRDAGFEIRDAETAASEDLIIAVRAKSDDLAEQALAYAEQLLAHRRDDGPAQAAVIPRSITRASRYSDTANLAVISVPGLYAMNEALQAIAARLHVFVFSDGVAVEGEIALKRRARDRGVLVMGPECGTSLVGVSALASPTACGVVQSDSWVPLAPGFRRSPRCSTTWVAASRTRSAPAAVTFMTASTGSRRCRRSSSSGATPPRGPW